MEETVQLLAQYQWIYDLKLTRFFVDRVWEKIPTQWHEVLLNMSLEDMNCLPFGSVKDDSPACFKQFIAECMDHSLSREKTMNIKTASGVTRVNPLDPSGLGADVKRGMSEKKLHEVSHMTALVDHVTKLAGNKLVVDVGSGLGYLGQALHQCCGHQVLGLEGRQCHTSGAEKRSTQRVKCPGLQNVTCELHQNAESRDKFLALLRSWFQKLPLDGSKCCHQTGSKKCFQRSKKDNHSQKVVSCGSIHVHEDEDNAITGKSINTCISKSDDNSNRKHVSKYNFKVGSIENRNESRCKFINENVENSVESLVGITWSKLDNAVGIANKELISGQVAKSVCDSDEQKKCEKCKVIQTHNAVCFVSDEFKAEKDDMMEEVDRDVTECLHDTEEVNSEHDICVNNDFYVLTDSRHKAESIASGTNTEITVDLEKSVEVNSCFDVESESTQDAQPCSSGTGVCCSKSVEVSTTSGNRMMADGHVLEREGHAEEGTALCSGSEKLLVENTEGFEDRDAELGHKVEEFLPDKPHGQQESERKEAAEGEELVHAEKELQTKEMGVCMVGLHCCGDLTPTMLNYFVDLDCIKGLCCVSCCYHRMKYDEAAGQFDNFPMSRCVQEVVAKVSHRYPGWSLNTYAMRLAAQETRARWRHQSQDEHDFHTRNVAYRALLELCLTQGQYVLKKTARRLAHRHDHDSYEKYVDTVAGHVQFPDTDGEVRSGFKQQMLALYHTHQQYFSYIEPFTALQFLIQPVLESLIHRDRQLWLQENGYHSNIIPIFDEFLSPRNLALVVIKH